ncbi:hypothetical protein AAG906_036203 [Vitis piasezkii]
MGAQRHFNPISKLAALRVEPVRHRLQTWIARFLCPEVLFPTSMLVAFEAGSLVRATLLLASVPLVYERLFNSRVWDAGRIISQGDDVMDNYYRRISVPRLMALSPVETSAGLNWPCCLTGVQGWIFCVHPEDLGGLLPQGQQIFVPLNVGEIAKKWANTEVEWSIVKWKEAKRGTERSEVE